MAPFGALRFLYLGSADVGADLAHYEGVLGAAKEWDFEAFGTRVAAVRLGEGPLLLLAGHRPKGTCIAIYEVPSLAKAAKALKAKGWKPDQGPLEIPNGPCYVWHDPSGNALAIFEDQRPGALEGHG